MTIYERLKETLSNINKIVHTNARSLNSLRIELWNATIAFNIRQEIDYNMGCYLPVKKEVNENEIYYYSDNDETGDLDIYGTSEYIRRLNNILDNLTNKQLEEIKDILINQNKYTIEKIAYNMTYEN